jgi:hypothetical protein
VTEAADVALGASNAEALNRLVGHRVMQGRVVEVLCVAGIRLTCAQS